MPENVSPPGRSRSAAVKRAKRLATARPAGRETIFTPLEALETLLDSRIVADYVEHLIQDALAPRVGRLSPAERRAIRAYLYDQLTSDPFLRGLISRIGRSLKARSRSTHLPSTRSHVRERSFPQRTFTLPGLSKARSSG